MKNRSPLVNVPTTPPGPNEHCWCGSGKKYKRCHQASDQSSVRKTPVALRRPVQPGMISPRRGVPAHIARPDYAVSGNPSDRPTNEILSDERLERMRQACKVAAQVLATIGAAVRPGITTEQLDELAHKEYLRLGSYPSTLNYRGYPKSICSSVNEVICHGIPDSRPLEDGDIVNLDVTAFFAGMHGDCSATYLVGQVDEESQRLVKVTHECLLIGIDAVKPGRLVYDIGRAIQAHAERHGFGVVRDYCGHGIGEKFHTSLQIPHYFEPTANQRLVPGMTFTIEPMITAGTWKHHVWDDNWTAVTADGQRSAQFEHTVIVTKDGCEVLTVLPGAAP